MKKQDAKNLALLAFAGALLGSVTAASGADQISQVFIRATIQGGLAEIQTRQLAQERTQSGEVKSYWQMLVTEHSASNEQAEKIAKQIEFTVASEPALAAEIIAEAKPRKAESKSRRGVRTNAKPFHPSTPSAAAPRPHYGCHFSRGQDC